MWHRGEKGNRILLLEPAFFDTYPVSQKCIDFMLALAKNIPNIHVYVGSFESLGLNAINTYYKEHPLNQGYRGLEEPRDWIVKEVEGYYPSFFVYWKNIQSYLPR
jgi:deoxyribodipyrimidine photo-lyase